MGKEEEEEEAEKERKEKKFDRSQHITILRT